MTNPIDAIIPAPRPGPHTAEWYVDRAMTWMEEARKADAHEIYPAVHAYAALAQVYATLAVADVLAVANNLADG